MNEEEFDLAIIGAGIIGVCTAWFARKHHPEWKIGLFDANEIGGGATQYSATLDIPFGHTPLRYKLSKRSRVLFEELKSELPLLPFKKLPFYGVLQKQNAEDILRHFSYGKPKFSPELIPELRTKFPEINFAKNSTIISGTYASQAINTKVPWLIAKSFSSTPGSKIFEHTKISSIDSCENLFSLNAGNGKSFHSKSIIQATGPWMLETLAPPFKTPVRIKKIVAFHLPRPPQKDASVFYFFDDDAFLMPRYEEGYWLFSYRCDEWDVLPEADSLSIKSNDIEKARDILKKYAPELASICETGRVFCDAYTADSDPVIEKAAGSLPYVIVGAGNGSGFRLAPAMAEQALNLLSIE